MRQQHPSTVGRDNDIQAVVAVLERPRPAQTLLITGAAGAGKSAVLDACRRRAVHEGAMVLCLDWKTSDAEPGGPALADAVCRLLTRIKDGGLPSRLTAIRRAELRGAGRDGDMALLSTLSEVISDAARSIPFSLVVDEVEAMPPPTASALGVLLRAFRPGVPVVLAGRSAVPALSAALLGAADHVLELAPLSEEEVRALIEDRLGRPVDPEVVHAITDSLGPLSGNPRAVLSVLAALVEDTRLLELDGRVHLVASPDDLRLGGSAEELCRIAWPGMPPDVDRLDAAVALGHLIGRAKFWIGDLNDPVLTACPRSAWIGSALDTFVIDGVLVTDDDDSVSFSVPAFAAALRAFPAPPDLPQLRAAVAAAVIDRLGPAVAGTLHPRLAEQVDSADEVFPAEVAGPLLLAAARKYAELAPSRAVRPYLAALRRLSPHDPRQAGALREAAAFGLSRGDYDMVLALGEPLGACLEARLGSPGDDLDRADLEYTARAWALAAWHEHRSPDGAHSGPWASVRRLLAGSGLAELGGRYGIGALSQGTGYDESGTGSPAATSDGARPATEPEPGRARAPGARALSDSSPVTADRPSTAALLPSDDQVRLIAAAVGGQAAVEAATRELPGGIAPDAAERLRNAAAYGDLAGALRAVLGDRYVMGTDSTAARYHAMVSAYLAGRWDEALVCARRIEARSRLRGEADTGQLARVLAAEIHWWTGDPDRAAEWLRKVPDTLVHPLVARVRVGITYASGHTADAFAGGWRDLRRARASGLLAGLDRLPLRIQRFSTTKEMPHTSWRAFEELKALERESGSAMAHESLLLGRVLSYRDVNEARQALDLLLARGDKPLIVLCHEYLAMVAEDPAPWLPVAVRGAEEMGMRHGERITVHRRAQSRGLKVPASRRRQTRKGPDELDIRLVELVSAGATNRQIAALLACSEKTVEQRLTRLFRFTGCRSRAELTAGWLEGSLFRTDTLVRRQQFE